MKKWERRQKAYATSCKKAKVVIAGAETRALLLHRLHKTFNEVRACPYCGTSLGRTVHINMCSSCSRSDRQVARRPDEKYTDLVDLQDHSLISQRLQDAHDLVHRDDA